MQQYEIDWFVNHMGQFFPQAFEDFKNFLPVDEQSDLLESYYQRIHHGTPDEQIAAAIAWNTYETACCCVMPAKNLDITAEDSVHIAQMETHYFRNNPFTPDNKLIKDVEKIRHIPSNVKFLI